MDTPPADQYDQLIEDATFDDFGDAVLGAFSLHRDDLGFVTIREWVNNTEVLRAERKAR